MFSKSLLALSVLALSSVALGAPALSCPAASTVTVVASSSSAAASVAVSSSAKAVTTTNVAVASSVAATTAAAATTSASSNKGSTGSTAASFGKCSTPEIKFAANLDGRRETSFAPVDAASFNHGSADNIDVISSFICGQLKSACKANAAALSTCTTASQAADAAAKGTGAQADAFNAAFGKTTNFAAVQAIGTNGKPVGGTGSSTTSAASGNKGVTTSAVLETTSVSVAATTNANSAKATSTSTAKGSTSTSAAGGNDNDAQSSTTLDPRVIATGFESDGQQVPTAGQVASATSSNNFINFCLTQPNLPITNGQQVKTGSCNPAPMGVIAATTNMPSSKFTFPTNFGTVKANTAFTISMALNHLEAGNFVNAQSNYYSAPQNVNAAGDIVGHTHVVIEKLTALDQTTATDPNVFAFFKGVNTPQVNGVVTADVTDGLDPGFYRLASINAAANHQPVLVAIAQHGSLDDMVYFTVTDDGAAAANTTTTGTESVSASASATVAASSAPAATTSAATSTGKGGNNNNKGNNKGNNRGNNNNDQNRNKFFGGH